MAELGFEVLGVDIDPHKVEILNSGHVPFYEPGLDEVLERNIASGRLRFTTDIAEAGRWGDVHFICVGTPQRRGSNAADLSQVFGSVDALAPHVRPDALVVGKSTVPVGTADEVERRVREASGAATAWNPEFLREGFAVEDTLHPDRLVIGVRNSNDEDVLRAVYAPLLAEGIPMVVTDFATAELVKVSANAFLATKISFINAMAEVCEAAGGDVVKLAEAIGYDPRIGNRFLAAGLGFGGGCLPKDIRAFMARAGEIGADQALTFLREVDEINLRRRHRTVDLARDAAGGTFAGKRITMLGAAFKPDSDDVRDSPALHVAALIHNEGGDVVVHDPKAVDNARRLFPNLTYADQLDDALKESDVIVLVTEWREYRELDPKRAATLVAAAHVIDARNALDPQSWRSAGFTYRGLGRPLA